MRIKKNAAVMDVELWEITKKKGENQEKKKLNIKNGWDFEVMGKNHISRQSIMFILAMCRLKKMIRFFWFILTVSRVYFVLLFSAVILRKNNEK